MPIHKIPEPNETTSNKEVKHEEYSKKEEKAENLQNNDDKAEKISNKHKAEMVVCKMS